MDKFFIITKRDENNPCALEALLKLIRKDDTIWVVRLNVETPDQIEPAFRWMQKRISSEKIHVTKDARKLVNKISMLASRTKCHYRCKKKFAEYIGKQLEQSLEAENCLLLYQAS